MSDQTAPLTQQRALKAISHFMDSILLLPMDAPHAEAIEAAAVNRRRPKRLGRPVLRVIEGGRA
jgi:hypothetical protein